jgi:alpha-mannosidase
MVYEDAEQLYSEVRKDGHMLLDEAFRVLFPKSVSVSPDTSLKTSGNSGDIVAFNTTFFARADVVKIPINGLAPYLKSKVMQTSKDGNVGYALMECPKGGSSATLVPGLNTLHMPVSGTNFLLPTQFAPLSHRYRQHTQMDRINLSSRILVSRLLYRTEG